MATSPNFSWPEPDNTDLVKNGALAIRTAVNAIDTSLAELKGGTTGQVLSKTSATDMDFTWVTTDDTNAIQNAIVDAKGDLIAATAADTPARLAVGSNGQVLTADSSTATGLAWATAAAGMSNPMTTTGDIIYSSPGSTPVRRGIGSTGQVLTVSGGVPTWASPAGGGKVLQVVNTTYATAVYTASSTYSDTGLTATITPTSATSKILVFVSQNGVGKDTGNTGVNLRLLRDATTIVQLEIRAGHTGSTATNFVGGSSTTYLDSPATTSATTYKTQLASNSGGNAAYVQGDNQRSTITLMEIGA